MGSSIPGSLPVTTETSFLPFDFVTATTAVGADELLTLTKSCAHLTLVSTLDVDVVIALDGVAWVVLGAGSPPLVFPFRENGGHLRSGIQIGVCRASGAPSSGYVNAISIPVR